METINIKIKQKLESYQELYDSNQNYLRWSKIEDIANRYFNNKSKRPYCWFFENHWNWKFKTQKSDSKEAKAIVEKKKEVVAEISVHVDEIRKEKKEKKLKPIIEKVQVTLS
jgi:DNA mismatch repair protein MutS2